MPESIFASGLGPGPANFSPLTPLRFLSRSAAIYPERTAIIHGPRRISYREFDTRSRRLASALAARGIGEGDTVAVVLPNVPAMLEAHQGVPSLGAVLNAINTRLDARTIAYILAHGEAKAIITDQQFSPTVREALARLDRKPFVVDLDDPLYEGPGERLGEIEYEELLAQGAPDFEARPIRNE
jgi:fatty-acyl-CoA synthase